MAHNPDLVKLISECSVKPFQLYRHYKGNIYRVINVAVVETNMMLCVNYRRVSSNLTESEIYWNRMLVDFLSEVTPGQKRFTLITENDLNV